MSRNGMGSHQSAKMKNDEWLTPPYILESLGAFDLDPCAPKIRPWDTAREHYHELGLMKPWEGRVWMNPPYGKHTGMWLERLASHGNGIALIFARTETKMFFSEVWNKATALLFLEGRINFYYVDGTISKNSSGAPSVLIAYGKNNADVLKGCGIPGKFIKLKQNRG
jgi:hypothetical protein